MELDFIVLEGEATQRAIEDDIAEDLAKIGITVNARFLPKDEFNEAMVNGDFNMAFSESWGGNYITQYYPLFFCCTLLLEFTTKIEKRM